MGVQISVENTHEVSIYIGCREGYSGPYVSQSRLERIIADYMSRTGWEGSAARISNVTYLVKSYKEEGYALDFIQYPRFRVEPAKLERNVIQLAHFLLLTLKQNRLTVVTPQKTYLFSSANAEASHVTSATNQG
jgi:hypothetical protein